MSPPWEQMQFVSNLISSKLFFYFPQSPMGMALKVELLVCFNTGTKKMGIHCHYHGSVKELYITLYHYPCLVLRGHTGRCI